MKKIALALSAGVLTLTAVSTFAASAPIMPSSSFSHWLFRVRGLVVNPDVRSSHITSIGGKVTDVSTQVVPEFDVSYFFTPHVAAELILATSRHSVKAAGTAVGSVNLGKVALLPPTLDLQYHILPTRMIDPYIGAGVNYTYFYDVDHGPVASKIRYSNSFGPAVEAGADININKHWVINLDVKKIFIETKARVTVGNAVDSAKVHLDPYIFGVGVGYRV